MWGLESDNNFTFSSSPSYNLRLRHYYLRISAGDNKILRWHKSLSEPGYIEATRVHLDLNKKNNSSNFHTKKQS